MAEQQTLPGAPDHGGLWRRHVTNSTIDHAAWLRARSEGQPVGTCRQCGDHLLPETPNDHNGRLDYTATCRSCDASLLAPGGRVMRGSGLWSTSGGAARAAALARQHRDRQETA
jgi:hypothetical protein